MKSTTIAPTESHSSIAKRALEEANVRKSTNKQSKQLPKEIGGRNGSDPTRFGDWEKNGISVDF
ncbi:DUF1674 domain-containing protein [Candidatus Liberibacter brunswickensis]|uniref:DUF1674 domain-containing protein n=1 Tax=Candidatus Liberibacter brunswickensis TaxID=1968796 RepID=UPI002FE249AC